MIDNIWCNINGHRIFINILNKDSIIIDSARQGDITRLELFQCLGDILYQLE